LLKAVGRRRAQAGHIGLLGSGVVLGPVVLPLEAAGEGAATAPAAVMAALATAAASVVVAAAFRFSASVQCHHLSMAVAFGLMPAPSR
jgi:hypothetical protein